MLPQVELPHDTCIRRIDAKDLDVVVELDAQLFGASRKAMIEGLWKLAPEYAFVAEEQGRAAGFCLGRHGENFEHVGPIAADTQEIAQFLATTVFVVLGKKPVLVDTTLHDPDWTDWLASLGFVEQRPFIRMYRGSNPHSGIPAKAFAIAGPALG